MNRVTLGSSSSSLDRFGHTQSRNNSNATVRDDIVSQSLQRQPRRGSASTLVSSDSKVLLKMDMRGYETGNGLYVSSRGTIRLPYSVTSSTPQAQYIIPGLAHVTIRHYIRVDVDFEGPVERLAFECGITISSVGLKTCEDLVDTYPEIVPKLSYDKVCGGDGDWVPAYSKLDA